MSIQSQEVDQLRSRVKDLEASLKSARAVAAIADKSAELARESASRAWRLAFQRRPEQES